MIGYRRHFVVGHLVFSEISSTFAPGSRLQAGQSQEQDTQNELRSYTSTLHQGPIQANLIIHTGVVGLRPVGRHFGILRLGLVVLLLIGNL